MSTSESSAAADSGQPSLTDYGPATSIGDPRITHTGPPTADPRREFRHLRAGSIVTINNTYVGEVIGRRKYNERETFTTDDYGHGLGVYELDLTAPDGVDSIVVATNRDWDIPAKYITDELSEPADALQVNVSNPSPPTQTDVETVETLRQVVGHRVLIKQRSGPKVSVVEIEEVRDGVVYLTSDSPGHAAYWVAEEQDTPHDLDKDDVAARQHTYGNQWVIPPQMDLTPGEYVLTDDGLIDPGLKFKSQLVDKTAFIRETFEDISTSPLEGEWDASTFTEATGPALDASVTEITGIGEKTALKMAGYNPNSTRVRSASRCRKRLEDDETVEIRELDADDVSDELLEAQANFDGPSDDHSPEPYAVGGIRAGEVPLFELGQYFLRAVSDGRAALAGDDGLSMEDLFILHSSATNATLYGEGGSPRTTYSELFFKQELPAVPYLAPAAAPSEYGPPFDSTDFGLVLSQYRSSRRQSEFLEDADNVFDAKLEQSGLPSSLYDLTKVDPKDFEAVTHAELNHANDRVAFFAAPDAPRHNSTDGETADWYASLDAFNETATQAHGDDVVSLPPSLEEAHRLSVPSELLEYVTALFGVDLVQAGPDQAVPSDAIMVNKEAGTLSIEHPSLDCYAVIIEL